MMIDTQIVVSFLVEWDLTRKENKRTFKGNRNLYLYLAVGYTDVYIFPTSSDFDFEICVFHN